MAEVPVRPGVPAQSVLLFHQQVNLLPLQHLHLLQLRGGAVGETALMVAVSLVQLVQLYLLLPCVTLHGVCARLSHVLGWTISCLLCWISETF